MRQHLLPPVIALALVILLTVGCGSHSTPSIAEIATATPTLPAAASATPWPTFTPAPPAFTLQPSPPDFIPTSLPPLAPVPSPTPVGVVAPTEPLSDLPLNLGNTWVYSATHYDTYGTERITATYRIIETVVDTKVYSSYRAAQILRTSAVMTLSDNLAGKDWPQHYLAGPDATGVYWYVISGTRVYQQETLDWAKIAADEATLEYIFPLSVNSLWYPDPQQRAEFLDFEVWPGTRTITGQVDRQVPAGLFRGCFEITTFYNGGSPVSWFCPGVGVVESRFDHAGTPFGQTTVLLDYRLASSRRDRSKCPGGGNGPAAG